MSYTPAMDHIATFIVVGFLAQMIDGTPLKRLGEVEEHFVSLLAPGAIFAVGGRPVELLKVEGLKAFVKPARGARVAVPRWMGSRMPLSASIEAELLAQRRLAVDVLDRGRDATELAADFERAFNLPNDVAITLADLYALQHRVARIPGVGEDHGTRGAVGLVPEERPVLRLISGGADLLVHTEAIEDREREWQERFADVESGEPLPLEEQDRTARAGKRRRHCGPAGPAADDDRVVD